MALDGLANTKEYTQYQGLNYSNNDGMLLYALQLAVNNALYWRERALKAEKMLEEEGLK